MISPESIPIVEETRDANFEDYFENMPIAGMYRSPSDTENPIPGEHFVATSQELLQKHKILVDTLTNFDFPPQHQAIYTALNESILGQQARLAESSVMQNEVRALAHAHENTHRDQEIRFKAFSRLLESRRLLELQLEDEDSIILDEYYEDVGNIFTSQVFQELQSSLAQYSTTSNAEIPEINLPSHSEISRESRLYSLGIDALYASSLLGKPTDQDEDSVDLLVNGVKKYGPGACNYLGMYPQLISKLVMFTGRYQLFDDIKNGNINAENIRMELASGLNEYNKNPEGTLDKFSSKENLIKVDQMLISTLDTL